MVQERERLRRDWVVFAWYFLHKGEMPDDEAVEIYASEALEWSETNRALVERFVLIHARHRNMLLARISAPEESVRTKEVNLWIYNSRKISGLSERLFRRTRSTRLSGSRLKDGRSHGTTPAPGACTYYFGPLVCS